MAAIVKPADCKSMQDVRAEIDRLDGELVALFTERASYITRAGEIKQVENLPAAIPERVEAVIANAKRLAEGNGLDGAFYADMWRKLVEHSIEMENRILED